MSETLNDAMARWFLDDADAVRFALTIWDATQQWDDIEDEGRCATPDALLHWLAFGKEVDPFFAEHAATLRPIFMSVHLQWRVANVLERSSDVGDIEKAWMLRAGIYGLYHAMAFLLGGYDHAEAVGPEIWRMYGESLAGFKEEMAACRVQ